MDSSLLNEMASQIEMPELLHKAWEPSRRYTEVSKGKGLDYQEMVVPYDDVKEFIKNGWSITRLSKLSQTYVNTKWMNAIIALEREVNADPKAIYIDEMEQQK
jgi:hypothetical protein